MRETLSRAKAAMGQANIYVRQANVLRKAGLTDFPRLDRGLRKLSAIRRFGAIAGPMHAVANGKGDQLGLVDELGSLSYAQLDSRSNALARAWGEWGMGAGSVVGVMCRDHRGLIDCILAGNKLGARVVLMNTGSSGPQLVEVVERERVKVLVYDQEFASLFVDVPARIPRCLAWIDDHLAAEELPVLSDLIADTDGRPVETPKQRGAVILLTSGTTGTPKGAPRQVSSPFAAAFFLERIPLRMYEATFIASPMFHATGFSQLAVGLALGSTLVVRRRFDAEETLRMMRDNGCSAIVLVPTMLARILDLDPSVIAKYDLSALRILLMAGSALSPEIGNRARRLFGPCVYNLYGSTEVAVATVATPQDWEKAPGTVGRAPHGVALRLLDSEDTVVTEPHVRGRIFLSNDLQFEGYTDGRTKATVEGMLGTGDVGHLDEEGRLFVDGRDDDMIVSGGENVYPAEVEDLLIGHEDISDVAVVGVPDEEFGQRLRAFVVLAEGATLDEEAVRDHVRENLARYKVPKQVVFLDEVPRNPTGKVLRRELVERD